MFNRFELKCPQFAMAKHRLQRIASLLTHQVIVNVAFTQWSLRIKSQAKQFNAFVFVFVLFILCRFAVDECKKRWRSLRDAFMKQYKLYSRGDTNSKKRWLFYEKMEFLGPYFDK